MVEDCMLQYKFGIINFYWKILKESERFSGKLCVNEAFQTVEELVSMLRWEHS